MSALQVSERGPVLTGDCLGCGRCAAACPTDALQVQGFPALPLPGQPAPSVTRLECWRVPEAPLRSGTLHVPCLGGLDASRMLTLHRLAGPSGITLVDRGWCQDCPAHGCGTGHPADRALETANHILGETGVPDADLPRFSLEPLSEGMASRDLPGRDLQARTGRRDFFRRLGGHAATVHGAREDNVGTDPAARVLVGKHVPSRRRRLAAELVAATGSATTPAAVPLLSVNGDCDGHGVCAAVCPTGALVRDRGDTTSRLHLDASACIACGLCQAHCPEQAIRVVADSGGQPTAELNRMEQRECDDCGRNFTARHAHENTCHPCRKSRRFAAAGFAFLTRGGPVVTDQNHGGKSG